MKRIALLSILGVAALANADVLIDNTASWDGGISGGWANVGEEFTAPTANLYSVDFYVQNRSTSSLTGELFIGEYSEASGSLVTGPVQLGSFFMSSGGPVDLHWEPINFGLNVGTNYLVYVHLDDGGANSGLEYSSGFQNPAALGGFTGDASGVWEIAPNNSSAYQVMSKLDFTGDAVPEPASMAALGLGVAALIRKRRKS
ncbi:MAG: PEP-CTERM sorting domain-containing protein [Armatimonadetes bacterium]|nr:PEP-CTERM sorting domain-containing protein [Armatimonadota bacterium]